MSRIFERRDLSRGFMVLGFALFAPILARAQTFGSGVPAPVGPVTPSDPGALPSAASPFSPSTNPYANPYLSPYYLSAAGGAPELGLLYFLGARREGGGIGSGRLGGSKAVAPGAATTEEQDAGAGVRSSRYFSGRMSRPGTGAERYFGRRQGAAGSAQGHFGRPSRRR